MTVVQQVKTTLVRCLLGAGFLVLMIAGGPGRAEARDLAVLPQVWCVQAPAGPTDLAACTNPTSIQTIQEAIDVATAGDEIRVAQGTYTGAGNAVITVGSSVTLTGGFSGGVGGWDTPAGGASSTVVDGQAINAALVVQGNPTVSVQNFAISNGDILNPGGTIDIANHSLSLQNSLSVSGAFTIAPGVSIDILSGSETLANGTTFGGGGLVDLNGARSRLGWRPATVSVSRICGSTAAP